MFSALRHLLLAITLLSAGASQAQDMPSDARVYLNAEPGSVIGFELAAPVVWQHGIDGSFSSFGTAADGVNIVFQDGALSWLFQFAGPGPGAALQVGRYEAAGMRGNAMPGQADILISSPLGMMMEASGWFDVREISYADNGSLGSFAVDFRQFDSAGLSGPSVFGSLRYNSSLALLLPAQVPEPATFGLMLASLLALGASGWRKRRSSSPCRARH